MVWRSRLATVGCSAELMNWRWDGMWAVELRMLGMLEEWRRSVFFE